MKTVTRCAVASLIAALSLRFMLSCRFALCSAVASLIQGKAPSGVQPCPGMQPSGLLTLPDHPVVAGDLQVLVPVCPAPYAHPEVVY